MPQKNSQLTQKSTHMMQKDTTKTCKLRTSAQITQKNAQRSYPQITRKLCAREHNNANKKQTTTARREEEKNEEGKGKNIMFFLFLLPFLRRKSGRGSRPHRCCGGRPHSAVRSTKVTNQRHACASTLPLPLVLFLLLFTFFLLSSSSVSSVAPSCSFLFLSLLLLLRVLCVLGILKIWVFLDV